jgi:hypothetical protein
MPISERDYMRERPSTDYGGGSGGGRRKAPPTVEEPNEDSGDTHLIVGQILLWAVVVLVIGFVLYLYMTT